GSAADLPAGVGGSCRQNAAARFHSGRPQIARGAVPLRQTNKSKNRRREGVLLATPSRRVGEPAGTRTQDTRIKSPVLYLLSYGLSSFAFCPAGTNTNA